MISTKTVCRCGFVWAISALFLFDGGKFLRAQEGEPTVENDETVDSEKVNLYELQPDWFKSDFEFNDKNRTLFVRTDPGDARVERTQAKRILLSTAIKQIQNEMKSWLGIENPNRITFTPEYVEENLIVDDHLAIRRDIECETAMQNSNYSELSKYQFYCGYAEIYLNDDFKSMILARNQELTTKKRLVKSGLIGGSILALLAVAFGYLKMEAATRGFYSRRLQTGSLLVAVTLILIAYYFGQQFN